MALDETIDSNATAPVTSNKGNTYRVSPYDGDILPNLSDRSKLYLAATKSLGKDKRWALNIENGRTIKSHLLQAAQKFGWESVVMIPLKYDAQGIPSPRTWRSVTRDSTQVWLSALLTTSLTLSLARPLLILTQ